MRGRSSAFLCIFATRPEARADPKASLPRLSPLVVYQQKKLTGSYAYNLTVSTFKAAGKDANKMTLGDITASSDWIAGSDEVQTLQANGAVDKAYTYIAPELASEAKCPVGWYLTSDVNDESKAETIGDYCKNAMPVKAGEAFIVLVGSAATTITIPSAL